MKPELILQADILDIIFEGRNKEYGAYNLRKDYNARMKKALLGVLTMVTVLFIFNLFDVFPITKSETLVITPQDIFLERVKVKPPDVVKPAELPKPKPATIQHTTIVIVNQDNVAPLPDIKELAKDVLIGTETIDGPPATTIQSPAESLGVDSNSTTPAEKPKQKDIVREYAEIMPEFPGGQAAFMRFLAKNLRVPENALEPGQKLKIIVRFVVGKEGELSNMQFLQTSGEVFEHEVLRVLKKMPRWKPGSQNGEKVQVYFNLPIIFDVPEE